MTLFISIHNDQAHPSTLWARGNEIRLFRMPDVDSRFFEPVRNGIKQLVDAYHLPFEVNVYGIDQAMSAQVNDAVHDSKLDFETLAGIVVQESLRDPRRGGLPHADVVITHIPYTGRYGDMGKSQFAQGLVTFSITPKTQTNFLERLAIHEAGRLLGYGLDHATEIEMWGSPYPKSTCNMEWSCPTITMCEQCDDFFTYFWKGVTDVTGIRFT